MKKHHNQFVRNIKHLIELINQKNTEYHILLMGGPVYSRKTIKYNPKTEKFTIINHIDDSKQILTHKQLLDEKCTLIGKAIPLNSLVAIIKTSKKSKTLITKHQKHHVEMPRM